MARGPRGSTSAGLIRHRCNIGPERRVVSSHFTAREPEQSPQQIRKCLALSDQELRAQCVVDTHRIGGPGGQHRNKTESAVRLFHRASGLTVTGQERRSQHQNAANALSRLREAIAVRFRVPLRVCHVWPESVRIHARRLKVSENNSAYFDVIAIALDALEAFSGSPQEAAAFLDVTTSSLVRFLADHDLAWREANQIRAKFGQPALKP
ncbi:MAG: peptide chain release factor-like protein [Phycisphaerales bacterium]|nr:peptide chain release factor-like protein [Phycisphaerales bacterium]